MGQFATSHARRQPDTEHIQTKAENAFFTNLLFISSFNAFVICNFGVTM